VSTRLAAGVGGATDVGAPDPDDLLRVVRTALEEDLRYGPDATTAATVPPDAVAVGAFTARAPGVLAGAPAARAVLDLVFLDLVADRGEPAAVPGSYAVLDARPDGARLAAGDTALVVRAPVRGLLTAERTALNLLCHLSGVATATAAWVDAVAGTGARIRDTRKTLPGLRLLEKYAVRCGGGVNHRLGLGDAVLVKDNHVAAARTRRTCRARSRSTRSTSSTRCWPSARSWCCWTTSRSRRRPRRSGGGGAHRPCWSRRAGWRWGTPARTPGPGWTSWRSGRSRTRSRRWTWAWTSAPAGDLPDLRGRAATEPSDPATTLAACSAAPT
jgi:nicotinate-nucleotide pyrophosphorylase